jgi:tetratricopeptide (TPR) repeat protein
MGKSFLMAKAVSELLDHDAGEHDEGTRVLVLPYRMRAGDGSRCRREALAQFVVERLEAEEALKDFFEDKEKAKGEERLDNALGALRDDVRVILPIDGLDEVMRRDENFAGEVPLGVRLPRVLWVCAGRPEPAIEDAMRRLGGETVFPEGLPPMRSSDIRGMILEKIGPLRRRLLAGDEEKDGEVINPFIERVTERAAGLPLYVKYVIGDVLGGRYRVLDGAEDLPDSLHAYHEELLRRLGVGDLQAVVTPLAATLACAHEPLSLRELVAVLAWRKLIAEEGGAELLERGLAAIESMIRTAPDPEGEVGYTLFHQSLRTHILSSDQMTHAVATTREAMADLSEEKEVPEVVRNYFLRCGVRHLLEAERREAAKERLLDQSVFETLYERDKYLLLGYWLELGEDVSAAYEAVFEGWERDEQESVASRLGGFLSTAGCYGDFTEALCRRALEGREKNFGPQHPDTLKSVSNLGTLLRAQGDYGGAETLYRRALEGREKNFGPQHPDTLKSVSNLGTLLRAQGDYGGAETLYRRALEGNEKTLGPYHPLTLRSVSELGNIFCARREFERAEELYRRSLEGHEKSLGATHPDTLGDIQNLGMALSGYGDYEGGEALFRRALEGLGKALGPEHPKTLNVANNLGILLRKKRDYEGALALFRRTLEGYENALGRDHPSTLDSVRSLSLLLKAQGDFTEAESLMRRALNGYEQSLGSLHPHTLGSVNNLGVFLNATGRRVEAVDILRHYAEVSPFSFDAVAYNLARYECIEGNLEEAKRVLAAHLENHPEKKEQALAQKDFAAIHNWIAETTFP